MKRKHGFYAATSMPDFCYEQENSGSIVGFDEAGCGPWAGPVVAGAVFLVQDRFPEVLAKEINDSKKLTAVKRDFLFERLKEIEGYACFSAVGMSSVQEIDQLNIRQATLQAIQRAALNLKVPDYFLPLTLGLVDGTLSPSLPYPSRSLIRGDSLSLSIAAASIIAKVTRDRWMINLAQQHPEFGWEKNKGYGTSVHQVALARYGPTSHHRFSFKPIQRAYEMNKKLNSLNRIN